MKKCCVYHQTFDAPGTECEGCKAEKRRLRDLHRAGYAEECEADRERKGLRVDLYAAIIEAGGSLFE